MKSIAMLLALLTAPITAEPWKTHYNKPKTTAWPQDSPAYSSIFGMKRTDLTISVTRYDASDCDPATQLPNIDHIYSPHCKTFTHPFRSLTYERWKPDKKDHDNAMALCQILVFAEPKCKGDAWVVNGTMLNAMGKCSGDIREVLWWDARAWSVKLLCVMGTGEMLPEGRIVGDFTGK